MADWRDLFNGWSNPGLVVHPDAPAGGSGPGFARPPRVAQHHGQRHRSHPPARLPHPDSPAGKHVRGQQTHPAAHGCNEPVRKAQTLKEYAALVDTAETNLIRTGHRSVGERVHLLTGIYYGTPASLDFATEHSVLRNVAFQIFTAHSPTDARSSFPIADIGCGTFRSLQISQDVGGVDMGHVMIGLDARMSWTSRVPAMPTQGASGVQITTWVGDLGGATARLALDRVSNAAATPDRYFRGTDFGAPSNLEGDVAAYLVADAGSSVVSEPTFPKDSIAAAVLSYFTEIHKDVHYRHFLEMLGGVFSGNTLTNRASVEQEIAQRLAAFGKRYLQNYLREHKREKEEPAATLRLDAAARDVTTRFVNWLLNRIQQSSKPARR
jgi:hypothetical protein